MNTKRAASILLKLIYWFLAGVFFMAGAIGVASYFGVISLPQESKVIDDLAGIEVLQVRQILPSKDFRVSGVMKNISKRDLSIAQIKIDVYHDGQLIDQCYAGTQELVTPGSSLPFLTICDHTELSMFSKPLTYKASVYQATFRK